MKEEEGKIPFLFFFWLEINMQDAALLLNYIILGILFVILQFKAIAAAGKQKNIMGGILNFNAGNIRGGKEAVVPGVGGRFFFVSWSAAAVKP